MNLYRVSSDGRVAIDTQVSYYTMDTCPIGLIVQLHVKNGVHTKGLIKSIKERDDYSGWRPVPEGIKNVE